MTTVITQEQGYTGLAIKLPRILTQSTLTQVTTAGWYNNYSVASGQPAVNPQDLLLICYAYGTTDQATAIFHVSIGANGVVTLSQEGSVVTLPTIANHIATYTNTTGNLSEDPATAISGGNIQAGLSGTAGALVSFPSTASKGSLKLAAVANTGDTVTTISNAAMGQSSVVSIPDPGAATAKFLLDHGANTLAAGASIVANKVNGTEAANAVTASGMAGVITTSALTTAGGGNYAITWTNSFISATSVVMFSISGGTNTVQNITFKCVPGSGTATLTIYNNTAATALDGTILISYLVM